MSVLSSKWTSAAWPGSRRVFYDMRNRVEHQKLNQEAAELPPGWVFGVQLGLRQTQAMIKMKTIRRGKVPPAILLLSSKLLLSCYIAVGNFPLAIVLILISACVCRRPSWTLKTQPGGSKLNQLAALLLPGWVFGVQLDYSCRLKSVSPDAEKVLVLDFMHWLGINI